ncbi:MAG: amidohydrolase family protein [Pseudomonadales bacterium]
MQVLCYNCPDCSTNSNDAFRLLHRGNHGVKARFTPQRLMFGSDWPVCTLTATFDEVYDITNLYLGKLSAHEQDLIMGESAALFYNIEPV